MVFQSADEGAVFELLPSQKRKEQKARAFAKTGYNAVNKKIEKEAKVSAKTRCEAENKKRKKKRVITPLHLA